MTKTTFILAGGNDRTSKDYGQHLSQEIAKHITNPRILSCFFSWTEETWEQKAKDWKGWFSDHLTQPFTYDYAKIDTLLQQVDAADVIYFHGGDTRLLVETLPDVNELKKHFNGKVVIGSSAGSNMLSQHFWSATRGALGEGKGVLDVNVMVHYGASEVNGNKRTQEDWDQEEAEFKERIDSQAVMHLPEGEFVVVEAETI